LTFGWKQVGLGYAKDLGKSADVEIGHNGALHLNVGQDIAGDVAPDQLEFRNQNFLCPSTLVAKFDHSRPDDVCPARHDRPPLQYHRHSSAKSCPATFADTSNLRWNTLKMSHRNRKP